MTATKSPDAFRTISEVSEELDVPQHVLRFWESKFTQIKPLKRGGGRRYYRPADMDLLKGIRTLLYGEGLTIRGVQKVFRDKGLRYVAEFGRLGQASEVGAEPYARPQERSAPPETAAASQRAPRTAEPMPLAHKVAEIEAALAQPVAPAPKPAAAPKPEPLQLSLVPEIEAGARATPAQAKAAAAEPSAPNAQAEPRGIADDERKALLARLEALATAKRAVDAVLKERAQRLQPQERRPAEPRRAVQGAVA